MYTSGTTGAAKGVVCPHGYFVCWGDDTSAAVRLGEGDLLYTPLPLFHITAQAVNVLAGLVVGCRVHVAERFSVTGFWSRMAELGATHVWSFGSMTPLLFRAPEDPAERAHDVRVVWSIPWPTGYGHDFEGRFGVKLMNGYGSTEQGLTVVQPYDQVRPDTIGKAAEHYEVAIVDAAGQPVADGELGDSYPPARARSDDERLSRARRRHGDRAARPLVPQRRSRGARLRRLLPLRRPQGRLDPPARREHLGLGGRVGRRPPPAVDECAAIAVPSELGEDDVKLVVVPSAALEPRALFDYCRDELPYYMVPRYVEIVAELPKTPSLRVQKFVLREQGVTDATWDCEREGLRIRRPEGTR